MAQQSQISFISKLKKTKIILQIYIRGITCGADNLADYQSSNTSTHTNCLIQIVKERFVEVFRLQRGGVFYTFQSNCQGLFSGIFQSFPSNSLLPLRFLRSSLVGRAFYSRLRTCQHPLQKKYKILHTRLFLRHLQLLLTIDSSHISDTLSMLRPYQHNTRPAQHTAILYTHSTRMPMHNPLYYR